jgi:8-oxo-dGTP diphosphatase
MLDGGQTEMKSGDYLKNGEIPPSFFRISIKAMVVRDGKVLLGEDWTDGAPEWELPGGGMDFGETPQGALIREVQEECGLEVLRVAKAPTYMVSVKHLNRRGLKEYWTLLVCYRAEFASYELACPSEECRQLKFFSKEEMEGVVLSPPTKDFLKLFDAEDFNDDFKEES